MGDECEHGQLARSCNLCEYEQDIAELKKQLYDANVAIDALCAFEHENDELKSELERLRGEPTEAMVTAARKADYALDATGHTGGALKYVTIYQAMRDAQENK